jgi:hypothetical protein
MKTTHRPYYTAMKADIAFQRALKKQFGTGCQSYRYLSIPDKRKKYNPATWEAYEQFRDATQAMHRHIA